MALELKMAYFISGLPSRIVGHRFDHRVEFHKAGVVDTSRRQRRSVIAYLSRVARHISLERDILAWRLSPHRHSSKYRRRKRYSLPRWSEQDKRSRLHVALKIARRPSMRQSSLISCIVS